MMGRLVFKVRWWSGGGSSTFFKNIIRWCDDEEVYFLKLNKNREFKERWGGGLRTIFYKWVFEYKLNKIMVGNDFFGWNNSGKVNF